MWAQVGGTDDGAVDRRARAGGDRVARSAGGPVGRAHAGSDGDLGPAARPAWPAHRSALGGHLADVRAPGGGAGAGPVGGAAARLTGRVKHVLVTGCGARVSSRAVGSGT